MIDPLAVWDGRVKIIPQSLLHAILADMFDTCCFVTPAHARVSYRNAENATLFREHSPASVVNHETPQERFTRLSA